MLDGLLGKKLLDFLIDLEELEGRLDNAIEKEGEVDEEAETDDLQPLERLPAEAERNDPDEKGTAGVDGGSRGGAHTTGDGDAKEVEATADNG